MILVKKYLWLFAGSAALSPAMNRSCLRRSNEISSSDDGRPDLVSVVAEKRIPDSRTFRLSATLSGRRRVAAEFATFFSRLKIEINFLFLILYSNPRPLDWKSPFLTTSHGS